MPSNKFDEFLAQIGAIFDGVLSTVTNIIDHTLERIGSWWDRCLLFLSDIIVAVIHFIKDRYQPLKDFALRLIDLCIILLFFGYVWAIGAEVSLLSSTPTRTLLNAVGRILQVISVLMVCLCAVVLMGLLIAHVINIIRSRPHGVAQAPVTTARQRRLKPISLLLLDVLIIIVVMVVTGVTEYQFKSEPLSITQRLFVAGLRLLKSTKPKPLEVTMKSISDEVQPSGSVVPNKDSETKTAGGDPQSVNQTDSTSKRVDPINTKEVEDARMETIRDTKRETSKDGIDVRQQPDSERAVSPELTNRIYRKADGIVPARVIRQTKPDYVKACEAQVQGEVILQFVVSKQGEPEAIRVTQGLNDAVDRDCVSTLRQWRFEPATKDARPVRSAQTVIFPFKFLGWEPILGCPGSKDFGFPPQSVGTMAPVEDEKTLRPEGVYKVGGGVSAPVLISKVEPNYTEEARRAQHQGKVTVYVEISEEGHPRNLRILNSLGMGLDEKALEAVAKWKFRPGFKDGRPVATQVTIEVNFRLL